MVLLTRWVDPARDDSGAEGRAARRNRQLAYTASGLGTVFADAVRLNGFGDSSLLSFITAYTASCGSVSTWDYCLTYTVWVLSFIGEDQ